MPHREIDSPSNDGAQLVASLFARIDGLMAQIAGRDERINELLAQVKALSARIAELEAKRGGPPKTPDNSSLPPSRGQKANAEPPAVKQRRKGRPGAAAARMCRVIGSFTLLESNYSRRVGWSRAGCLGGG